MEHENIIETLIVPLFTRAKYGDVFAKKALDAIQRDELLGPKISNIRAVDKAVVERSQIFDDELSAFLVKKPDAVILNLGCGLCTRYFRVHNGRAKWCDVDFPSVIEVRQRVFGSLKNHKYEAANISDSTFFGYDILIAEGVMMYLTEARCRQILKGNVLFDVLGIINHVTKWKWPTNKQWLMDIISDTAYGHTPRMGRVIRAHI